jgi:hypothetical protein
MMIMRLGWTVCVLCCGAGGGRQEDHAGVGSARLCGGETVAGAAAATCKAKRSSAVRTIASMSVRSAVSPMASAESSAQGTGAGCPCDAVDFGDNVRHVLQCGATAMRRRRPRVPGSCASYSALNCRLTLLVLFLALAGRACASLSVPSCDVQAVWKSWLQQGFGHDGADLSEQPPVYTRCFGRRAAVRPCDQRHDRFTTRRPRFLDL